MSKLMLVEIPQGSNVKYEIHDDQVIMVDRISSQPYPYTYGYFINTLAEDGDALDAIILNNLQLHPGVLAKVRPVGLVRMTDAGVQDDKVLTMIEGTEQLTDAERSKALTVLHDFFSSYKAGTQVEVVYIHGFVEHDEITAMIENAQRKFEEKHRL